MTKEEKQRLLGAFGENFVYGFFRKVSNNVFLSDNPFDPEKDLTVIEDPSEVKAGEPFHYFPHNGKKEPAFTISLTGLNGKIYYNQFNKCKAVKRLFFVTVSKRFNYVAIYEAPPADKRNWIYYTRKNGTKCVAILLSTCKELFRTTDPEIVATGQSYLTSDFV